MTESQENVVECDLTLAQQSRIMSILSVKGQTHDQRANRSGTVELAQCQGLR